MNAPKLDEGIIMSPAPSSVTRFSTGYFVRETAKTWLRFVTSSVQRLTPMPGSSSTVARTSTAPGSSGRSIPSNTNVVLLPARSMRRFAAERFETFLHSTRLPSCSLEKNTCQRSISRVVSRRNRASPATLLTMPVTPQPREASAKRILMASFSSTGASARANSAAPATTAM